MAQGAKEILTQKQSLLKMCSRIYSVPTHTPPVSSSILRPFISVLVCQPPAELVKINGKVQLEILPRLEDFTKLVEVTRTATATYIHSH